MRGLASIVSLALVLEGPSALAQAPAPAAQPAAPQAAAPAPQPPAPFPAGAKIAFVDFQRLAQESIEGQNSTAKINALVQKKQAEGAEKARKLQADQQRLQQSGGVMSDQARSQLEKDIERQQRDAERFQQDAQAEINELQQELQLEFQKKILPLIQQVAVDKGLHMLLSRADAGIVWWDPGVDVTADVVKRLDAITPKPAAPPAAAAPAKPAPAPATPPAPARPAPAPAGPAPPPR
jgi:outer membrane protein